MKLLLTAKQRGSTNVLAPVARELSQRGHQLTLYATGNENEAAGFNGLQYEKMDPSADQYPSLVCGYDAVIVGLSGYTTPDGYFLRAANEAKIPTIAVQDQNSNYVGRLGTNPADLPTLLAVMGEDCRETARKELGDEAAKRCRVIGWTAFDNLAKLREEFIESDRENLLHKLGLNQEDKIYFHATQNIHPLSNYSMGSLKKNATGDWNVLAAEMRSLLENKGPIFDYEMKVTAAVFEAASDLGIKLVVKPHPGEQFERNFTKEMTERHGFVYVPSFVESPHNSCSTLDLMLISYSVTAGRSTCLTEAALLDRNTGAILPGEMGKAWGTTGSQAISLGAIPVTYEWNGVGEVLCLVTSQNKTVARKLAEDRTKFSVDGKASQRLADLVEGLK